jgi:uncharacterized protein YkwD
VGAWRPVIHPARIALLFTAGGGLSIAVGLFTLGLLGGSGPDSTSAAFADAGSPGLPPAALIDPTATALPPTATPAPTEVPTEVPPTPTETPPTATPLPPATAVPVAPTQAPASQPPATAVGLHALEQAMFNSHNAQRAGAGLPGLSIDSRLMQVARQRAQDMASRGYFSHTSPSGETAFTILNQIGYAYRLAGENIARNNYPDSQSVEISMTGFMNSQSHRENILEPVYQRVGIGVAFGADGMKYFAVVFSN